MVPDKFNMVDMGGIDLIMMQGEEVPGLYNRLVESIAQCRYQCLYNWFFDGVVIPSSYVEMEVGENEEIIINDGVTVTPDDVIHIYSIEPSPVDPEIIPLLAEENGTYSVPSGTDGFNPVTVNVPSYTPVIESITITENDTYTAPSGVDGFNPVIVNVPAQQPEYEAVTPDFFGLATAYQALTGAFYQNNTKTQCLFIAPLEANTEYIVFLPNTVGNRFRVGVWNGKTIDDFEPYLDSPVSSPQEIYTGANVITGGTELQNEGLTRRFYFTGVNGSVIIGTSSTSQLIYPILLKHNI